MNALKTEGSRGIPADEILTVQDAAQMLNISYSHMLRLIKGRVHGVPPVPHVRAGRSVRVRRAALMQWIANVERRSPDSLLQSPSGLSRTLGRKETAHAKLRSLQTDTCAEGENS